MPASFEGTVLPEWGVVVCLFIRVFVAVTTLPLGTQVKFIPRALLAMGIAIGILPLIDASTSDVTISWAGQITMEVILGLLISLPVRFFVEGASMLGELIDTARGQTIGSVQDPLHGPGGSDLAVIFKTASLTATLYFGGLCYLVEAAALTVKGFHPGQSPGLVSLLSTGIPISLLLAPLSASVSLGALWIVPFITVDLVAAIGHRMCQALSFSQITTIAKAAITFLLVALLVWDRTLSGYEWLRTADPRLVVTALGSAETTGQSVSGHFQR